MASFVPDTILQLFHGIPRLNPSGGTAPSSFGALSLNAPYVQAVLLQTGFFAAWAGACGLLFTIAFIAAVTCCRSYKAPASCLCRCRRSCFALLTLAMMGPVIAALVLTAGWRRGVDDALSAAQRISGVLTGAAVTVNSPLVAAESQLAATAAALEAAAAGVPSVAAGAAAFRASADSALATTQALGASLADASAFIARELNLAGNFSGRVPSVNLDEVRSGLSTGTWALLGAGLLWLLIMLATQAPTRASAACFRFTSPAAIALGAALPALAGALYGGALVGADFCAAPAESASSLLNFSSAPSFAASTVVFYATCVAGAGGAPGGTPPGGAAAALAALSDAQAAVAGLNASVAADGGAPALALLPLLGDASFAIGLANASASELQAAVACAPVQAAWLDVLAAGCNVALAGVARTALVVIPAALAMTLLLCFGVSLCRFHAGDAAGSEPGPRDDGLEGVRFGYGRRGEPVEWGATNHVAKYSTTAYERSYGTA